MTKSMSTSPPPRPRLQGLLDQSGEAILEPVLGQLARHPDAERAAVSGHHRRVFQPHVVGALGELEPQLLLHLRPDLVLIQLPPPLPSLPRQAIASRVV